MYRIINVTDRDGNVKHEFIAQMKEVHPDLIGEITNKAFLKQWIPCSLRFLWNDKSGKVMLTSTVLDFVEEGDVITVTTLNSIYTIRKENK